MHQMAMQSVPTFSHRLQVGEDGEREMITLEELKPHNQQTTRVVEPYYLMQNSCSTSFLNHGMNTNSMDLHQGHAVRKRKISSCYADMDEDTGDDNKSVRTDDTRKQNHSEIEKRRRDKMNTYITELSDMIPMCSAMSRKLDKLTVLRMTVQYMKTIQGETNCFTVGNCKPPLLSDLELKNVILKAADGFLFVVGCDHGSILYVSQSVVQTLNYTQNDLLGQNWFDVVHPKDVAKVKEQLSSSDLNPRERLIDAKTMLPVKADITQGGSRLCPGSRRSFFCRMKYNTDDIQVKEETDNTAGGCQTMSKQDRRYCVIQCTGYLKSWSPSKLGLQEDVADSSGEPTSLSCLVAVGRLLPQLPIFTSMQYHDPPNIRTIQFTSRHAMDGKFLFVDQRSTLVLGFLPQELVGTAMHEYHHHEDVAYLAEVHKAVVLSPTNERLVTKPYRFRTKDDSFIRLTSEWKTFKNPWTKEVEYIVAKNCVLLEGLEGLTKKLDDSSQNRSSFEFFSESADLGQGSIKCHVDVSKAGCFVAEQLKGNKACRDICAEVSNSSLSDREPRLPAQPHVESSDSSTQLSPLGSTSQTRHGHLGPHSIPLSADDVTIDMIDEADLPSSSLHATNDGNDEAAMAVIMSLLEADAGLGGPVDFTGLPWPLP